MPEEQQQASKPDTPKPPKPKPLTSGNVKTPQMVVVACLSMSKDSADGYVNSLGQEKAGKLVELYNAATKVGATNQERNALREGLQLPEKKEAEKPSK